MNINFNFDQSLMPQTYLHHQIGMIHLDSDTCQCLSSRPVRVLLAYHEKRIGHYNWKTETENNVNANADP